MVYFPPDFRDLPETPPESEPPMERCAWCEIEYAPPSSNAMAYQTFCRIECEEQSANTERIR